MRLLKDILDAWKKEVEKKPPSMSIEEALEVLKLDKGVGGYGIEGSLHLKLGTWTLS